MWPVPKVTPPSRPWLLGRGPWRVRRSGAVARFPGPEWGGDREARRGRVGLPGPRFAGRFPVSPYPADFEDRVEAGARLAEELSQRSWRNPVVLGIPRGGVVVAAAVADALRAPLDAILVRKLGVPEQPELALGAIGESGDPVLNRSVVAATGLTPQELAAMATQERLALGRSAAHLRVACPMLPLQQRTAIIVDDGIATGATAAAACQVARGQTVLGVVVATPVAAPSAVADLRTQADEIVCLLTPEPFLAVGAHYHDFSPTSDQLVESLIRSRRTDPL